MFKCKFFIVSITTLALVITSALFVKAQYVVPIIMYHNIDEKSVSSSLSVSPGSFKKQMCFLKNQHYNVVKLEDLADMVKKNKFPLKTITITFDDGYENNYTQAYPVLKSIGLCATIFIVPALVGTDGYLTWDQIIEMSESGVISIGSHSMRHAWLPDMSDQKLDSEISGSKRAIESHVRKDIYAFSYPLGGFNKNARDHVIKAGYKIAVATNPGKKPSQPSIAGAPPQASITRLEMQVQQLKSLVHAYVRSVIASLPT